MRAAFSASGSEGTTAARHRQRSLINRNRRDIGASEFIDEPIAVFIHADGEAFLGLHPMVVREGVVGELPQ